MSDFVTRSRKTMGKSQIENLVKGHSTASSSSSSSESIDDDSFEYALPDTYQPEDYSNEPSVESTVYNFQNFPYEWSNESNLYSALHTNPQTIFRPTRNQTYPVVAPPVLPHSYPIAASSPSFEFNVTLDYDIPLGQSYDTPGTVAAVLPKSVATTNRDRNPWSYFDSEHQTSQTSSNSISETSNFNSSGLWLSNEESPVSRSKCRSIQSTEVKRSSMPTAESQYLEKRRIQNRNSQRAFRERKASYINKLEDKLSTLQKKYDLLLECSRNLRSAYANVEKVLESKAAEDSTIAASGWDRRVSQSGH